MLKSLIIKEIQDKGPMPQDRFMELALSHPDYGYYRTQESVTKDFTTAPEISQMFGELIGVWVHDIYEQLGKPNKIDLVELGPGKGTMMADVLRVIPDLSPVLNVYFIEIHSKLKETQLSKVQQAHSLESFDKLPQTSNPLIILANEFFDVLPTKYYERKNNNLFERCIGIKDGELKFELCQREESQGYDQLWEESPRTERILEQICSRILEQQGAFLCFDYGYEKGQGDSLQALYKGAPSRVLQHIGKSDLTCHVNFGRLKELALRYGLCVKGPTQQGHFLMNMGLDVRMDMLKHKNPSKNTSLELEALRLVHPQQMGSIFKGFTAFSPYLKPKGFEL